MQHQRLYELIARKLSGEATAEELQELQQHLQHDAADQYLYEIMTTWWSQHTELMQDDDANEEERLQRIWQATEHAVPELPLPDPTTPVKRIYQRKWFRYAAVVAALAGLTALVWPYLFRPSSPQQLVATELNEVSAKAGSRSKLVLPDGTQVWLNGESKLSYRSNFKQSFREVTLEGEAYFDVSHDKEHPFIVHTTGIDIKVLGTAFNVKSYAADPTIEATLLRGSIEVVRKHDENAPRIILRPHEKLVFVKKFPEDSDADPERLEGYKNTNIPQTGFSITTVPANKPDSVMTETSWIYNKLVFDGDTFQEVAEKMQRWYNVQITIDNEKVKAMRLKGSFEKETVREALEALQLTAPFEFTIYGNSIRIEGEEK